MNLKAKYPQGLPGMLVSSRCPPQAHSKPPSLQKHKPWATTYILTLTHVWPYKVLSLWSATLFSGVSPWVSKRSKSFTGGHVQRIQRGGAHHPWSLTVLESQDRWEMVWDNERKVDCGVRPTRVNFSFCHLLGVVVGSWGCQAGQRRDQGWLLTLQHLQALQPLVYHTLS